MITWNIYQNAFQSPSILRLVTTDGSTQNHNSPLFKIYENLTRKINNVWFVSEDNTFLRRTEQCLLVNGDDSASSSSFSFSAVRFLLFLFFFCVTPLSCASQNVVIFVWNFSFSGGETHTLNCTPQHHLY